MGVAVSTFHTTLIWQAQRYQRWLGALAGWNSLETVIFRFDKNLLSLGKYLGIFW